MPTPQGPTTDELYHAIHQIIALGRLTGFGPSLSIDGRRLFPEGDDTVVPSAIAWREDGFSVSTNAYGARQVKHVEELRGRLLSDTSPVNKKLGEEMPQWFGNENDSGLTDFQKYQLTVNASHWKFSLLWLGGAAYAKQLCHFTERSVQFVHKSDGSPVWVLANAKGETKQVPVKLVKDVPNMRICVLPFTALEITQEMANWVAAELAARKGNPAIDFSPVTPRK